MMTPRTIDRALIAGVAVVCMAFATAMLTQYIAAPDTLWTDVHHDRNSHLSQGIAYAVALRSFNVTEFADQILRSTVWPPVHGLALGLILTPHVDFRLGIVPSLIGWSATVIFVAAIARRLFDDPLPGVVAGVIAAIFTLASPAFRLLGSDVMLEGLGAGLTACALYLYVRAMAAPDDPRRWRWLALVLTLVFFEKYNYWAMLVASLAVAFLAERPRLSWTTARDLLASFNRREVLRSILRDPLLIAATIVLLVVACIYARGPTSVEAFGRAVRLYPPENLLTVAYALIIISVGLRWRRHRGDVEARLGPLLRALSYWHVAPVMLSFVIPKRLSAFVWYLGPNNGLAAPRSNPVSAVQFQWPGFTEGFHVASWSAVLVLALAAIGAIRLHRLAPGARIVAIFALVSAAALLIHPQQQWRFQATWLSGLWICAGVGGAVLIQWATHQRPLVVRTTIALTAIAALAIAHILQPVSAMAERVAIRDSSRPSDLAFARAYLPHIKGRGPVGFITTFGRTSFPVWSVRNACGCDRTVDAPFDGNTREEARASTAAWIARTSAERIVTIDAPGAYELPKIGITSEILGGGIDAMATQDRYERTIAVPVPEFNAVVSVWQRKNGM